MSDEETKAMFWTAMQGVEPLKQSGRIPRAEQQPRKVLTLPHGAKRTKRPPLSRAMFTYYRKK